MGNSASGSNHTAWTENVTNETDKKALEAITDVQGKCSELSELYEKKHNEFLKLYINIKLLEYIYEKTKTDDASEIIMEKLISLRIVNGVLIQIN